ncbi:MAG TPA: SpoIIE family protein phosphatase [Herpetosiphonaceae bacterium]|nr:SpoIIE family protein phosphatase [Herpetosiphonaceae bacterium]
MRILVVDDSPAQCMILAAMLRSAGYAEVLTAHSAEAAYAVLGGTAAAPPRPIDLILMDLRMPGTDGITACQTIKASEALHDIPILMVTSSADLGDLTRAFEAGAMDYISKPPNAVELLARLSSALRLKRETDQRKAHAQELLALMEQIRHEQQRSDRLVADLRAEQSRSERMAGDLRRQNERFQQDMILARTIQLSLLPQQPPWGQRSVAGGGLSIPASEVGGDFYTYVEFRDQQMIGAVIGDVSGKGVGAALMMALVLSAVESQLRDLQRPRDLLPALNRSLMAHLQRSRMNAALMYVLIDLAERTLWVANAGMIAPLLIRAGAVQAIDVCGLPLGAMAQPAYAEAQIRLQSGDLLVLVSDGIVEAHNAQGELFGFERLEQVLGRHPAAHAPSRLIGELIAATRAFTGGCEQHDDMTVVAICPYPPLL